MSEYTYDIIIYVLLSFIKLQNLVHAVASELTTLLSKKQQSLGSSVSVDVGGTMLYAEKVPPSLPSEYLFSFPCLCFPLEYENIHGNIQAFVS